jgi:hypothetical protein
MAAGPAPARRQRAAAGHRGRAEQADGGRAGPARDEAIGHATGTAAPERIMTACAGLDEMLAELVIRRSAPTGTRTRDLLLRRHFRNVPGWCWAWPDVPFRWSGNGWGCPDVALYLWSLAPRLAPRISLAALMFECSWPEADPVSPSRRPIRLGQTRPAAARPLRLVKAGTRTDCREPPLVRASDRAR